MPGETLKPYTFSETDHMVEGLFYTATVVREGVFIGDSLGIKYIRERGQNIHIVEFVLLEKNRGQENRFQEEMRTFKRYQYHYGSLDVFLRWGISRYQSGTSLQLMVEAPLVISTARRLGRRL